MRNDLATTMIAFGAPGDGRPSCPEETQMHIVEEEESARTGKVHPRLDAVVNGILVRLDRWENHGLGRLPKYYAVKYRVLLWLGRLGWGN